MVLLKTDHPITRRQNFRQLKQTADDILKIENIVKKCYKQFLLFSQSFPTALYL